MRAVSDNVIDHGRAPLEPGAPSFALPGPPRTGLSPWGGQAKGGNHTLKANKNPVAQSPSAPPQAFSGDNPDKPASPAARSDSPSSPPSPAPQPFPVVDRALR